MKCEICKKQDANVFIKQVIDGVVKKLHACQDCARERGFEVKLPMPLLKDLLFGGEPGSKPKAPARERACPACGMTAAEFRKSSLLGCPACYDAFEDEVAPYLDSLPDNPGHCGKAPVKERMAAETAAIQRSLKQAVDAQDFEEAARLRDRVKALRDAVLSGRKAEGGARRNDSIGDGAR